MDTHVLLEKLAEVLSMDPAQVSPATRLDGDTWDSLAVLSAIALVDEMYGVSVSGDALARCTTVQEILGVVEDAVDHQPSEG